LPRQFQAVNFIQGLLVEGRRYDLAQMNRPRQLPEHERLETLRRYNILDTPPDRALDELTFLASQICETPIALISLIDENRQWFKSKVGLDAMFSARRQSFCAHALNQQNALLVVPDAAKDDRFSSNPMVMGEPGIRFYAGAPLVAPNNATLGTLCVIDRAPRELVPAQEKSLQALARQVVSHLESQYHLGVLKHSEKTLKSAFDRAAIGMALVSLEGRWLKVNDALSELLGYTSEEFQGKTFQELTHPDDLEADLEKMKDLVEGKISGYRMKKRYFHKQGNMVWGELSVSLVKDEHGLPLYFSSQVQDITELKEALAVQEKLAAKALATERAKSDFLAIMSHEIRTPMNGVIGMAAVLAESNLDEAQRDCVETITTSGEALLAVINGILDFSKIESGKMTLERKKFSLQKCVEESLGIFGEQIRAKGLEAVFLIAPDVPQDLMGDPLRLRQILINLLGNAVKFTSKGEIVINVEVQEKSDQEYRLLFSVADTGIGISAEGQIKLFEAFQQVDTSTTRKYGGSGLGLTICKKLTTLMGGEMGVESVVGQGSTFSFILPMTSASEPMGSPPMARTTGLLRIPTILIVDSNVASRKALESQIRNWRMVGTCASTGKEALEHLTGRSFDLVIVDERLSDYGAVDLAQAVTAIRQIPLVLLTSESVVQGQGLFQGQLRKPLKGSQLFSAIAKITGAVEAPAPVSEKIFEANLAEAHPLRILLAEDNFINQKVVLKMLAGFGFHADVASNGQDALQAALGTAYDLILMDIQMPEMDGIQAATLIRAEQKAASPAIIALTAEALENDEQRFLSNGFDGYLSKPLQVSKLKSVLLGTSRRPSG
jgi:two-component system sensor histidine kinase/response regulator